MPYREESTWSFDLSDIDCPELRVTARDPLDLPSTYQRKVGQAWVFFDRARKDPREQIPTWAVTAMEDLIRESIIDWNLPYPKRHPQAGQVIPLTFDRSAFVAAFTRDLPPLPTGGTPEEQAAAETARQAAIEKAADAAAAAYDFLDPVPGYVFAEIVDQMRGRLMAVPKRG